MHYNWFVRLIYIKAAATGMRYCEQIGPRRCGVEKLEVSHAHQWQIYGHRCSVLRGDRYRRVEVPMINWPEIFRDVEHWADGFLAGAASASLVAVAVAAIVLLARVT
jgi:hypothetical protein